MDTKAYEDVEFFLSHKFTHLVVGGGTAGLVVAARLAENATVVVGVLEAGVAAFDEPLINIPGRFGETLGSKYDWKFETTPQAGINGRRLLWPRGKVLGGSSALNFTTWNRGNKEDYDGWEELGGEGWGWEGMLPFFKKSEHFHEPDPKHQSQFQSYYDAKFHGIEGPIQTGYSSEYAASHQYWHAALNNLGVQTNRSHFSGSNVGVWTSIGSVDGKLQERSYSATAYYKPNSGRPNLVLLTEAVVREVVLEDQAQEWVANRVRFMHHGEEYTVATEGEVIICAGSVQSPQLLELSGIGNPDVLKAAGISLKVDNPNVGENLQDHMMTAMVYEINPSIPTQESLRTDPILAEAADVSYATSKSGPYTITACSFAYLPHSHFVPSNDLAAITSSLNIDPASLRDRILIRRLFSADPLGQTEYVLHLGNNSPYFASRPGKKYATIWQMLQYPFSKGSIHIPAMENGKTVTSDDKPVIDPQYFAGPGGQVDFLMMVAGQKFADKICSTKPLSDIILSRVFPIPDLNMAPKDEDFAAWVRDTTITDWHPVGTCAMGGREAKDGYVTDARLRVYGVKGLRVVDASIMPLQIGAHLQATIYAIGEKGAQMILEDWESRVTVK